MRCVWLCIAACAALSGQTTRTYTIDGLGDRTGGSTYDVLGDSRTELVRTMNGRSVPAEQVEERVLSNEGGVKTVERVIRRYDPTGSPLGRERVVERIAKASDGSVSIQSSTYRRDISGNMTLAERAATQARTSGGSTTETTVIERPSIDGSFQTAERREVVSDESPARDRKNTGVYVRDDSGRFVESLKETVETTKNGDQSVANAARYQLGSSGRLELAAQTVTTSVKRADGSQSIVEDVYTQQTTGVANQDGAPKLKEQRLIDRKVTADGAAETVSLRVPSLGDPNRLGPARKVAESVCKGKCP